MSLSDISTTISLDLYDHDLTPSKIKAIALDSKTRYVNAQLTKGGQQYDIGQSTAVTLTIIRPDKTGVQVTGATYSYLVYIDGTETTMYGARAELTQTALAVSGTLQAQFMFTSGEQILRSEIFTINNGVALDSTVSEWAGEYQGYNLDELVQNVNTAVGKVDAMEQDVTDLKEGLTNITGLNALQYKLGWIDCNAETIDVTHINPSTAGYKYAVDECSEGDAYIVNGTGALSAKSWCFVDANQNRLTYQPDSQTICRSERVIAPANAAYFVTNYRISMSTNPYAIKETSGIISNRVDLIGDHKYANRIEDNTDLNSVVNVGNYYIPTVASANTMLNMPIKIGGRLTVITLSQDTAYMQMYSSSTGRRFWRVYSSGAWTDWKEIADKATVEEDVAIGNAQEKGAYNAIKALISQATYNIAFANAFSPIRLKNYLGNTQNVHPKVLYIPDGFGGHNYWVAYTPYPNSNDAYENPCVAYSDDGYNWTNISGNPLDDPNGNGYNSDTHLVYRADTGVLECWYRYVGPATQDPREETIYRQTTNDGVTWSAKEMLYSNVSGNYAKLLSPSVIVENGKYCIWVAYSGRIDYYEAPLANPTQWTFVRSIRFTITDGGISVSPWHIDVIKDGDAYAILMMCRNGTQITNNACSLFIATSEDNTSYSAPVKVVGGADNWDKYMYRSSIVKVNDIYRIYYSATKGGTTSIYNNAIWGIGITESNELTSGYVGKY